MLGHGLGIVAALSPAASVIAWGLVLIVVLLIVGTGLDAARKRWQASSRRGGQEGSGFSMERLEGLHRRGLISDGEFQRLRRQVLGLSDAANPPPSGSSPPPAGDDGNAGSSG